MKSIPRNLLSFLDCQVLVFKPILLISFSANISTNSFHIGTGKGGKSIWGEKFEDEIVPHLKVKKQEQDSSNFCYSSSCVKNIPELCVSIVNI